jgi:hypothetical protein
MTPDIQLEPLEARVLGVLIEKELTTPDQYPLSLNAITLGSNQKNNRDPVMELMEGDINVAVQKLVRRSLVGSVHPVGSRVERFRHNGAAVLSLETPQLAVLAELMLRGPQQPGELRGRIARMTPCDSLERLYEILRPMIESGLAVRLDPSPGSRAERFAQKLAPTAHAFNSPSYATLGAVPHSAPTVTSTAQMHASPAAPARDARVGPLEEKVEAQEKQIAELETSVSRLRRQLDQLAWQLGKKLES